MIRFSPIINYICKIIKVFFDAQLGCYTEPGGNENEPNVLGNKHTIKDKEK